MTQKRRHASKHSRCQMAPSAETRTFSNGWKPDLLLHCGIMYWGKDHHGKYALCPWTVKALLVIYLSASVLYLFPAVVLVPRHSAGKMRFDKQQQVYVKKKHMQNLHHCSSRTLSTDFLTSEHFNGLLTFDFERAKLWVVSWLRRIKMLRRIRESRLTPKVGYIKKA